MKLINLILIGLLHLLNSCEKDTPVILHETQHTDLLDITDWEPKSHGKNARPDYEMVFPQNNVLRVDIVFDEKNWEAMNRDLDNNLMNKGSRRGESDFTPVWVPCSFYFDNKQWYKVGIRFKGNSSLHGTYMREIKKFSFKLDFDQFEDTWPQIKNQRFYGFKQLNLKNNFEDPSEIREKVAADLFKAFGLPSAETAFYTLYIDYGSGPIYFGLYTLVEEIDDTQLAHYFGSDKGNLYKPEGISASFANGYFSEEEMQKKNNKNADDFTDIYTLYNIINSNARISDTTAWKNQLESILDVDIFLQWLAANTAMQNWDSYGKMWHNYYLYNNPGNNLLTWIPWDNNEALQQGKRGGAVSISLNEIDYQWPLIRNILSIEAYQNTYNSYLKSFTLNHFTPNKMDLVYTKYSTLIKNFVEAETPEYSFLRSAFDFQNAISDLKQHTRQRNAIIQAHLLQGTDQ